MDNFRDFANELEPAFGSHAPEVQHELDSSDERRRQVRAYNYWTSLLAGREFPSIEDLEPSSIADFAKHSVLLDFTGGPASATAAYVGAALRRECGMEADGESLAELLAGTLLAHLGGYYPQILESRAPVGVQLAFANQRGEGRCYRGILMPFSSDGDTIDFVYGVFNWSDAEVTGDTGAANQADADEDVLELSEDAAFEPEELELTEEHDLLELDEAVDALELTEAHQAVDAVEPAAQRHGNSQPQDDSMRVLRAVLPQHPAAEAGSEAGFEQPAAPWFEPEIGSFGAPEPEARAEQAQAAAVSWSDPAPEPEADEDEAELVEWLVAAQATAEDAKVADGRSRQALYRALSEAYDFACAAADAPQEYQRLMEECGIVPQARAPMTPVVKLVFGSDYDKARLTEYAAALSIGSRQGVERGGFLDFIEGSDGGLKGLVEAERKLRRPDGRPAGDWREQVTSRLRVAEARPLDSLAGNGEFALVLVRRDATGEVAPIAAVSDPALLDRALKKAAH